MREEGESEGAREEGGGGGEGVRANERGREALAEEVGEAMASTLGYE